MVPVLALAACGGGDDGAAVEGTFAPGLAPTGVWVVESERGEPADSGGFALADLTPGPASLRLMNGSDTAAVLNLSGLASGTRVRLEGLRVDDESGFAFPRAVQLEGADVVMVNGLRMAPASRVPREVDLRGTVLGWSSDVGALLFRPEDARLPDLRVVVGMATQLVGEDGGGADATSLEPGDSIRVEGRSENGYVVATRITVPTRIAGSADAGGADWDEGASGEVGRGGGEGGTGGGGAVVSRIPAGGTATPPPRIIDPRSRGRDESIGRDDGHAREHGNNGRGRGNEKGKGNGKGNKKG